MKRTIIWVIIVIFVLSACSAPSGAEQGRTTSNTVSATQMASSTTATTNTTVPTTSTVPTTISTVPTTVSTAPTTVTTVPTTVSTTQSTTSTKATTNTTKPTTNTTKPTTITTIPTSSTTQAEDGLLYRGNRITVYREEESYIFDITMGGSVEFTTDRIVVRTHRIEPIKYDNYQELLNYSFNDVKSMFGEPHFDEGSGFYIPSYITEDAHILSLYPNNDGIIEGVFLNDPTRNEPTKYWTIYDEQ